MLSKCLLGKVEYTIPNIEPFAASKMDSTFEN